MKLLFFLLVLLKNDLSRVITPPLPKSSIKPAVWTSSPSTPSATETSSEVWRTPLTLTAVLAVLLISVTLIAFLLNIEKNKPTEELISSLSTTVEVAYILQNNPTDGRIVEKLKNRCNEITEVQYIISQDGASHFIPQLVMESQNVRMNHGQMVHDEYENADSEGSAA